MDATHVYSYSKYPVEPVILAIVQCLRLFDIEVIPHYMTSTFDLPESRERVLIVWTPKCKLLHEIDWFKLLDKEVLSKRQMNISFLEVGGTCHHLLQYLINNGAQRLMPNRFLLDYLQMGPSVSARPIEKSDTLADAITKTLEHGRSGIDKEQIKELRNIMPWLDCNLLEGRTR